MGGHRPDHCFPADLDVRDPAFPGKFLLWRHQQQCEIVELIARTKETIAASRALLDEADLLLTLR